MEKQRLSSIARQAGWYYLAIIVLGLYFIMYVPSKIKVPGLKAWFSA